jgi:hypothetical protein
VARLSGASRATALALSVAIAGLLGAVVVRWTFVGAPQPLDYIPLVASLAGLSALGYAAIIIVRGAASPAAPGSGAEGRGDEVKR